MNKDTRDRLISSVWEAAIRRYEAGEWSPKDSRTIWQASVSDDWLPIKDAPKDGTPVLVAWKGTGFDPAKAHHEDGLWGELRSDMSFDVFDEQPTHWVYLPVGPK